MLTALKTKKEILNNFLKNKNIISGIYKMVQKKGVGYTDPLGLTLKSKITGTFYVFKYLDRYNVERLFIFPENSIYVEKTYSTYPMDNFKVLDNYECVESAVDPNTNFVAEFLYQYYCKMNKDFTEL